MNDRRLWTAGVGAAGITAVVLAGVLLREVVPPVDAWILDNLYAAPGGTAAAIATAISGVGTLLSFGALLVGAVAVWRRDRARANRLLATSLTVGLLCASVLLLQNLILRPGPPLQPAAGTYPSGHVTIVTALVLAALVLYGSLGRSWRLAALAGGSCVIVLVAASRVALAEHWLLDVTAAVVGTAGVGLIAAAVLGVGPAARSLSTSCRAVHSS